MKYIDARYGSLHAFKLLKYFIENKLARDSKGYAVYELAFNIAPSQVLCRYALIRIECIADGADAKDAEQGLKSLLESGTLRCDAETDILELNVPLDSLVNVHLRETDEGFEAAPEPASRDDMTLLLTESREGTISDGEKLPIVGVPDLIYKGKVVELKFAEGSGTSSTIVVRRTSHHSGWGV
jgi:hypothetical protein